MKKYILSIVCAVIAICCHAQNPEVEKSVAADSMVMIKASALDSLRSDLRSIKKELNDIEEKEHYKGVWSRRRSWTIGYVNSTLSDDGAGSGEDLKSKFGVAMHFSNTYLLHNKPLFGMIRFGIDAIWTDITYVKYKSELLDFGDYTESFDRQQVDIGMGIGPSVNIAPFASYNNGLRFLRASLYFHATPSASIMVMDDESNAAFNVFMNLGLKISYRRLGFGIEGRWGSAKYDLYEPEEDEYDGYYSESTKSKLKTSSLRAFISLNF